MGDASRYEFFFGSLGQLLRTLQFDRQAIPFHDETFFAIDRTITEHVSLESTEIETFLIRQNELSTAKASASIEGTNDISEEEARSVIDRIDRNLTEISKEEAQARHNELEFANIVRAYRFVNAREISFQNLSIEVLQEMHRQLSHGLDAFSETVDEFTTYRPGVLRTSDTIKVGTYEPLLSRYIKDELDLLIRFFADREPTIAEVFIFSLALYAIHPFHNGNKRLCRILEHAILRSLGLNRANMYSHITELYASPEQFFSHLRVSLNNRVCNPFVKGQLNALLYGQMGALRAAAEFQRAEFISRALRGDQRRHITNIAKLFVGRKAMRYSEVRASYRPQGQEGRVNDKIITQSLATLVTMGVLRKVRSGKDSYYSLHVHYAVEDAAAGLYAEIRDLAFAVPDNFLYSILLNREIVNI